MVCFDEKTTKSFCILIFLNFAGFLNRAVSSFGCFLHFFLKIFNCLFNAFMVVPSDCLSYTK